eukprot:CAMPEP_0204352992 /NCGR_PEP_ID=MMETSP0469-20131031/32324_1 /ASSEMBLY_ACC=CAM_ASM_000384 /TAXON_ID=2969 /ORGANISM="Oxyrrhis marina" /LENGTH=47 /DNA_ID= /DNA_START= /DNA_END= /DNA_ORIENTATION=
MAVATSRRTPRLTARRQGKLPGGAMLACAMGNIVRTLAQTSEGSAPA